MPRPPRWLLPTVVYEITARTLGGQFLFRPDDASREVILGSIGRALSLNSDIFLHGFVFLSNHCHLLISSSTGDHISSFLGQLKSNVARKIGRLRQRPGKLWEEDSAIIPITDNEALLARTRYLLSQSVKEGLVERPEQWPGASSLPWFLGEELTGSWIERRLQRKAERRCDGGSLSACTLHYPIKISPVPCWKELSRFEITSRTMTSLMASQRKHGSDASMMSWGSNRFWQRILWRSRHNLSRSGPRRNAILRASPSAQHSMLSIERL